MQRNMLLLFCIIGLNCMTVACFVLFCCFNIMVHYFTLISDLEDLDLKPNKPS